MTAALWLRSFGGLLFLGVVLGVALFGSAGTTAYPEAWGYLCVFLGSSSLITFHLAMTDPALLRRRVAAGPAAERRGRQRVIQTLAQFAFLAILIVPALDRRFGWSHVPLLAVAVGEGLVALGFGTVFQVFRTNSFASATIEVGREQRVISTGPYARVRHPMYSGALLLLLGTPIALGSWWGLLAWIPMLVAIVSRLVDEERFLTESLPGYREYCGRVRWRLVPGVF
jgi:protein-S-isoprenylcysteine O-methyltransferase Ste14